MVVKMKEREKQREKEKEKEKEQKRKEGVCYIEVEGEAYLDEVEMGEGDHHDER